MGSERLPEYFYAVYRDEVCAALTIRSFARQEIHAFFTGGVIPRRAGWARLSRVAARKLSMVDYAYELDDLVAPPGNRLEALKGELLGLFSIRINDQWRVVFRWTDRGAEDVDIVDYHG